MLKTIRTDITAEDYFRAKFVIEEKDRVLAVCDALVAGDYITVGQKMYETHKGLSEDYEVSCEELDFLNEVAKECHWLPYNGGRLRWLYHKSRKR